MKALPCSDRSLEQDLWKRLSSDRASFDKRRRAHFAQLDSQRKEAVAAKRELITKAEALADSTDWGPTTRAFRSLMDQWKRAPRGSRSDEDKLWKKFKAAQDSFYSAMKAADAAKDAELTPNVEVKEALVVKAETLLPLDGSTDLGQVKRQLRSIQEQWDKAGDLPRSDRSRLESRLKKVEDAVRKAESSAWDRDDPDKRARAESTANAFTDALAKQEADLDKAAPPAMSEQCANWSSPSRAPGRYSRQPNESPNSDTGLAPHVLVGQVPATVVPGLDAVRVVNTLDGPHGLQYRSQLFRVGHLEGEPRGRDPVPRRGNRRTQDVYAYPTGRA